MPIRPNTEAAEAKIDVWAVEAVGDLRFQLNAAAQVRKDLADEVSTPFAVINVNKLGALVARQKAEGSDVVSDSPTTGNVPVTLSYHTTVSWEVELTLRLALDPRQTRRNIRSFSDRREAEAWAPRQHAGTKLRMKCDPIDRTRAFLDGEEKSNNPLGFVVGVLFLVAGVAMVTGYIRT